MWQHVRTQNKIWQYVGNLWPFYDNPVCPDPVWKPVTKARAIHGKVAQVQLLASCLFCLYTLYVFSMIY